MKKVFFLGSIVLCLSLLASTAWGACHVITPLGSGTKSGSDWNNACAGLTAACSPSSGMARGDVYYLASGTYPSATFSRANSGQLTITVKSPIAGDHCTDTGFNASTHVGQAVFNGGILFDSDFWVIDGKYGTHQQKGSFGIKVRWTTGTGNPIQCRNGCDSSTFKNIEMQGAGSSGCDNGFQIDGYNHSPAETANVLIDRLYAYGSSTEIKVNSTNNVTVQNSVFSENTSTSSCHGSNFAMNDSTNITARYNKWINCAGTSCIDGGACAVCGVNRNVSLYGNVFYNDLSKSGSCPGSFTCLSLAMIAALGGSGFDGLQFYNNTVANWTPPTLGSSGALAVFANSSGTLVNVDVKDNIFHNITGGVDLSEADTCGSNSYHSSPLVGGSCSGPGDVKGLTTNPFVNSTSDFHLVAATADSTTLSSPFNLDPDGLTRGADGIWDRGAFEFDSGVQRPQPPTGLSAVVR